MRPIQRRFLIGAGVALTCCASPIIRASRADPAPAAASAVSPKEALARLLAGNARYVANRPNAADYSAGRVERAKAQYPIAAILSCADSRVVPELAFDQGPGQVFVVRLAGNFVNGDGLASLEYGVRFLSAPLIVVLGHSGCGAISAAIKVVKEGTVLPGHLANLVQELTPAVRTAMAAKPADLLGEATRENVRRNVAQLRADQPIISEEVAKGSVRVVGAFYDIATGQVSLV